MLRRALLLSVLVLAAAPAAAPAFRLGLAPAPVPGNPAERFVTVAPVDPAAYDHARRCTHRPAVGARLLERWLVLSTPGSSWGIERCERWGKRSASLHAEGRAIDWNLDSRVRAQRAAGARLIRMLLAPDRTGAPHALARRMGVQELIWDCSIWTAGGADFRRYGPCYSRDGRKRRRRVNPTIAHFDHIHIGLTKAGAGARTTFWRAR